VARESAPGSTDRPAEIRELPELTYYRIRLVRLRTSRKYQLHAVLAKL
jgi:hypothetical protein